jgi:hypothetical protein
MIKKFQNIELPSDFKFGLFFSIIFLILSIYFYQNNSVIACYAFGLIFITFFIITILKPKLLNFLNKYWMIFGYSLSVVISPILMGLIFFFIFTPVSLIFKIFGRDILGLKNMKNYSYWKFRSKEIRNNHFKDQF